MEPIKFVRWDEQADGSLRPRTIFGPTERRLGFKSRLLRHGKTGPWFTFEEVRAYMLGPDGLHAQIAAARAARDSVAAPATRMPRTPADRALEKLLRDFMASPDFARLMPKTQRGYRKQFNCIIYRPRPKTAKRDYLPDPEPFARAPVEAIDTPELKAFFEKQFKERGLYAARASIAMISSAWTWGQADKFWRLGPNPRKDKLRMPVPDGRIVVYTDREIRALVATADALGYHSIGDAILLGLFTGQRQEDRLLLEDQGLVAGRRRFCQSKTGAIVDIPETPELAARLAAARQRVAAIKAKWPDSTAATVVVCETTGEAWQQDAYRRRFNAMRKHAGIGIANNVLLRIVGRNDPEPAWLVAPCPSIAGKRDQDLRDTAVTWLARAGCTLPEIGSITGHSLQSIHQIMKHYLAMSPELADSAIAKLVAWMKREGINVTEGE